METPAALQTLVDAILGSRLVGPGSRGVVMVSGGADSACLAAGLVEVAGRANMEALHINYGLRDDSDRDEAVCRQLCARLRIDLRVERPKLGPGNTQAGAREARYDAAERLRNSAGAKWIATGHTRSDLAETVLYRMTTSPGSRALLGLAPRNGRVVRPLLALGREQTRAVAGDIGLPYKDDPSNEDPRYARTRIRHEVLPVLREMNPAVERNIAATWAELSEEADALEGFAQDALLAAGVIDGETAIRADALSSLHPAIRRIALRRLARWALGRSSALGAVRAAEVWRVACRPEGGVVELSGGLMAICESGWIRFEAEPRPADQEAIKISRAATVGLPVPGVCSWGSWSLQAEVRDGIVRPSGPDLATLDSDALGSDLGVRCWREGDRIRPLGLGGTKSLQDLFTDHRVPRSIRHSVPLVVAGDRIAWVPGLAVSEDFRIRPTTRSATVITATDWR